MITTTLNEKLQYDLSDTPAMLSDWMSQVLGINL